MTSNNYLKEIVRKKAQDIASKALIQAVKETYTAPEGLTLDHYEFEVKFIDFDVSVKRKI